MLFVTLHGGNLRPRNNVHAYDEGGKLITSPVLEDSENVSLNELRGICLAGNYFYVVNANKYQNSVLCYQGTGTDYRYVSTVVSSRTCNGILRPFDITFDGLGYCYVSSQDANVVTRLKVSGDGAARSAPLAAGLPDREGSCQAPLWLRARATCLREPLHRLALPLVLDT